MEEKSACINLRETVQQDSLHNTCKQNANFRNQSKKEAYSDTNKTNTN
jgi:hypothetical protein